MGRITSNIGLITGVPIQETVEQLIALSARPRDLITARVAALKQEQTAITELTALVIGVQLSANKLAEPAPFEALNISSSNEDLITASVTGKPAPGTYTFIPVQTAQSHQLLTNGFRSLDQELGSGKLSLRFGGHVDKGLALEHTNEGRGFQRGKIRITDRSGESSVVDLRFARSVDDVLEAINFDESINVRAEIDGDSIRLTDRTGLTISGLKVQQIGAGTTAADLGLANVDVDSDTVLGGDILSLHDELQLTVLNDNNGITLRSELPDLEVRFRDGSSPLLIDLDAPPQSSGTTSAANGVDAEVTITANQGGGAFDDVTVRFVDDGTVTQGSETVVYDDSDPDNKQLTFNIEAGQTTANDIVAALANAPFVNQIFSAAAGGDGSGVIDLADTSVTSGGSEQVPLADRTLGELLASVNGADPARLAARISADGDRLEFIDLTADGGNAFTVRSILGGSTAEDLGLTGAANGNTISSSRLLSGLKSTLLSSFNGGNGLGTLGQITISDRAGASATVDLSSAETLEQAIDVINAAGIGVRADVNAARNGLVINDTTGQEGANLIVANADSTNTADLLQITGDVADDSIDSGSLNRQNINEHILLEDLNNGKGIDDGSFLITDSTGKVGAVNLAVIDANNLTDVINAINGLNVDVTARINDTGDGIALIDTGNGTQKLKVEDVGAGTAAEDLSIAGESVEVIVNGTTTKLIDGRTTIEVELEEGDTVQDLLDKLTELDADITASIFNDGYSNHPHHLSIVSNILGERGELLIDVSEFDAISLREVIAAKDALLLAGSPDSIGAGVLAASNDNQFDSVIEGVELNIKQSSTTPVEINIEATDEKVLSAVNLFVDAFNRLREKVDDLTFFDEENESTGVLFGSGEIIRLESRLANLLTGRILGAGSVQSLEALGISLNDQGKLDFDQTQFSERYEKDPESVEAFFTTEEFGAAARFDQLTEFLAGEDHSLLLTRQSTLQRKIDIANERIAGHDERLENERERLFKQFFAMETAVARLQAGLSSLQALQPIPPL